jgi:hypothetical protein
MNSLGFSTLAGADGQQTIGKKIDRFIRAVKRKLLEISNSVLFVAEDRLAVIASTDDVIDSSGYSILTGHAIGPTYSRPRLITISFHLYKPDPDVLP